MKTESSTLMAENNENKIFFSPIVDYSIVVPVFNSEKTLNSLYQRLVEFFAQWGATLEIVFVDDGSRDRSWEIVSNLAQSDSRVKGIQLMRNFGQANATLCGFSYAQGQFIITIDDDLQNPPEEIAKLINRLESDDNLDVVIGSFRQKKHALWRRAGSLILNWWSSMIFQKKSSLRLTSFRLMRRSVAECLLDFNTPHPAIGALICSVTSRIANVEVDHHERMIGRGSYTIVKLFSLTLSKFLSFSTMPLRFLAGLGLVGLLVSILLGVVLLVQYLLGQITVPGYTSLALLLIGVSGLNFLVFGIMGEYLLRILQAGYATPAYRVRQVVKS
jgi:dolichol-phosphate mannosyltransferase/undecaprenyl-phosphate 4-deoxy-4-formamido-L-arabinose transferase